MIIVIKYVILGGLFESKCVIVQVELCSVIENCKSKIDSDGVVVVISTNDSHTMNVNNV